jgi:hypothetical protein
MGEPFRIEPALPVTAVKTYQVAAPRATHWRPATCAEADCPHYLHGWVTIVPADSPQAHYIRHECGRSFTEALQPGGLVEFTFEPGQRCFASSQHQVPKDIPEIFIERDGDWRGNPTGRRIQHSVTGWLDSFGEHQERLAEAQKEG